MPARPTAALEHDRLSLKRSESVLADLVPVDLPGVGSDFGTINAEIALHAPGLAVPCRVSGRLGPVTPFPGLFVPLNDNGLHEAQPRCLCWPAVIPNLRGHGSLADYPQLTLTAGTFLYLQSTWSILPDGIGCTGPELFFSPNPQLEDANDLSDFPPGGTTRTWVFSIGGCDSTGRFYLDDTGLVPFIPPPLIR